LSNPSEKPKKQKKSEQQKGAGRQRQCGTFVLRQSLSAMTHDERQKIFKVMASVGMTPVI
jgi:hypothetical protein